MLLPDKARLAQLLRRYRTWEQLVLQEPHNPVRRRRLDDVAYTLCVLMGHRNAHEAIRAAESYLGRSHRGVQARKAADVRDAARARNAADVRNAARARKAAEARKATGISGAGEF